MLSFSSILGGDFGITQTVNHMQGQIVAALHDPMALIRLRAESLLSFTQERNEIEEVTTIFFWVQSHFHYVSDPVDIELVKSPLLIDQEVTRSGYFMGDCDDATGYLAALLKSVGYPVALVTVTPLDSDTFDYRHIYLRVFLPRRGAWLALDPTAKGKPAGWEVANKKEKTRVI